MAAYHQQHTKNKLRRSEKSRGINAAHGKRDVAAGGMACSKRQSSRRRGVA